ncbi:MAG: glutamate synthase large subunit [Verrucomicrobiota bacterium]
MALNDSILDRAGDLPQRGLYDPATEHDGCGVGFVASIKGERCHSILKMAIDSVCALTHRGAMDADAKTGDGAGLMTQIPYDLFRPEVEALGHKLWHDGDLGVGVFFMPLEDKYTQAHIRKITEDILAEKGLCLFGWRPVPVNMDVLGDKALRTCPWIEQVLVGKPEDEDISDDEYERRLFLVRNMVEAKAQEENIRHFYVPSFSCRTIVYKGLLASPQLERFYTDLRQESYDTAFAIFHQRYSTNTFPTWPLAQSFRTLAHNGEINTIQGNRNWMAAREKVMSHEYWGEEIKFFQPVIQPGASDSASLDNALELLVMSGRELLQSVMMLVPSAWQHEERMPTEVKEFYEYHGCLNEPWDGPAALAFSDGKTVGACLDRNGLRPARYHITDEGLFVMSSEVGVVELDDKHVVEKGRLAPGEIIAIDLEGKKLLRNDEIKMDYATRQPYADWVHQQMRRLETPIGLDAEPESEATLLQQQINAGINKEETDLFLLPMAETGQEAIGSMGDDAALAVLSKKARSLYTYFSQHFAQVTNPPIDPIREKLVMSVEMWLGRRRNWLAESPEHANLLHIQSPCLSNAQLEEIKNLDDPNLKATTVACHFDPDQDGSGLQAALEQICKEAEEAVDRGNSIVILSDRGIDAHTASLPMLLAVGTVHHHLIKVGKRMECSLVAEAADCRDVTHFALLVGYGASAVNPYAALATLAELHGKGRIKKVEDAAVVAQNYQKAVDKGLLKIMSKMGVSTLASYCGGQIFEAVGLGQEIVDAAFTGTPSKIGGIGWAELAEESLQRWRRAFQSEEDPSLDDAGWYRFRRDGDTHAYTPQVIQAFHAYVGLKKPEDAGNPETYDRYIEALLANEPMAVRHMLKLKDGLEPIPLDEVEPIDEIRSRFTTAAMSYGALSPEAHEALAIAMNRIGGKSNSGEGGEDPERFHPMPNGDSKNSRIKQVASGRFGVTAEYLASATEIEIKMAQGAKPGEGGQLMGYKVIGMIAKLRKASEGTTLISPPPHHDIYSIEDLAQLIYDLKQVNPRAKVCVKLVSEAGVGTIAAGVAKAHADIILISGHDGGTGASPISSIKAAGTAWELGLAETQQVLLLNGLRNRVTLRTDGGIKTGMDIVIASLLGAEEYNFGTSALIALGCVYVRKCHLNTCPVGVTTQDERLRGKFKGSPDMVVTFFNGVAEETRQILARMGARSINDIIGRTDLLVQREVPDHPKANTLDLTRLLAMPELEETAKRYHTWERNDKEEDRPLDAVILQDAKSSLQTKTPIKLDYKIKNTNRSVGAMLSGEIAYRYGDHDMPEGTLDVTLRGSAGQSFGAFLVDGVRLRLLGEANDYVGKCMTGGEIILCPPADVPFHPSRNFICGNTVLYGASGGALFARGRAGERFAVRNSGATAVVQGVGDHGCEYMTNGTIVVLGPCGKNFGAGMSGGTAYILDEDEMFGHLYNPDMIEIKRLEFAEDIQELKSLIFRHLEATDSKQSSEILDQWSQYQPKFWKVAPKPAVPPGAEKKEEAKPSPSPNGAEPKPGVTTRGEVKTAPAS